MNKKSVRLTVALMGMSLAGFACNSNNNNNNNGHTPQVQAEQGPAWKLNYTADTGADSDKAGVVAGYGFTVTADGNYIVGPGPQGQVLTGQLSTDEYNQVFTAIQPVLDVNALTQTETCAPSNVSDTNDRFVLTRAHKDYAFLRKSQDGTVCAKGIDTDGAENLRTAVLAAAQNHYVLPFPSACLDAAAAAEVLFPALQSCHHDSDCAYLDNQYNPIDAGASNLVFVDSCSVVKSLPVANAQAVQAKLADLQAALLTTQQACGADIVRANCVAPTTFSSTQAPPVCDSQGMCKVNPSLRF